MSSLKNWFAGFGEAVAKAVTLAAGANVAKTKDAGNKKSVRKFSGPAPKNYPEKGRIGTFN